MKVALVSLHRGGMAHYAAMLAHSMLTHSDSTQVACFVCSDFPPDLLPEKAQVFYYEVPHAANVRQWRPWIRAPRVLFQLQRDLRAWHPDVLHVNSSHPCIIPLITQFQRDYPLVYTMHDVTAHPGEGSLYKRFKSYAFLKYADRIIFHSESIRSQALNIHRVHPDRTAVIPCGVLHLGSAVSGTQDERPNHLLLLGRIRTYKGYDVLFQALPRIAEAIPNVHVTLAGEGAIHAWRDLIDSQADRITVLNRFLSECELHDLLRSASLVILPYVEASQSGVALLAASYEKPVVASRVGAIPDVVEDGVTGRLVEPGRADLLAEAIIELLLDPVRRRRLGRSARLQNEERYGPAVIGAQLRDLYDKVLRDRSKGSSHA